MTDDRIIIKGLRQNNLKNISLEIPKNRIVVFTGVSGSGKSSIVFDTIASESQRQMNDTYSAWIRGRLPKYEKPMVESIENLSASVIVDQTRLGGNSRSTVGTISDMYASLRLLYSRIGVPHVGTASFFSFNDPQGMCPKCHGKRLNRMALTSKINGYTIDEMAAMEFTSLRKVLQGIDAPGVQNVLDSLILTLTRMIDIGLPYLSMDRESSTLSGGEALEFFDGNKKIRKKLAALCEVGLSYISLGQAASTLSGGERQRLKLARDLDRKGNIYVLDEPTTGLHASDVEKLMLLFDRMVDKGNTVIVIEHNLDVMKRADYIIDVGPDGGRFGGEIVFTGTPRSMIECSGTITAKCLKYAVNGVRLSAQQLDEVTMSCDADDDIAIRKEETEEDSGDFDWENEFNF